MKEVWIDVKGFVGYCWHKEQNKWMAYIYLDKKIKHLGYFVKEENAERAYLKALHNA